MKNVKHIAEEIFKAPTREDLAERFFEDIYEKVKISDEVEYRTTKLKGKQRVKTGPAGTIPYYTSKLLRGTIKDKKQIGNQKFITIEREVTHKTEEIPLNHFTHLYITWRPQLDAEGVVMRPAHRIAASILKFSFIDAVELKQEIEEIFNPSYDSMFMGKLLEHFRWKSTYADFQHSYGKLVVTNLKLKETHDQQEDQDELLAYVAEGTAELHNNKNEPVWKFNINWKKFFERNTTNLFFLDMMRKDRHQSFSFDHRSHSYKFVRDRISLY